MSTPSVDCVFCKIISGQISANNQEYEDNDCLVIHDISPKAPTHLLVVAKSHGVEFVSANPDYLIRLLIVSRRMIADKGLSESYRLAINGGSATFVSNHLHIHILGSVDKNRSV